MNIKRLARAIAWCLLLTASRGFAADAAVADTRIADESWRVLSSPRFTVVSQLSESETRIWAKEFDLFISSAVQFFNSNLATLPPTTVVLFSRDKNFTPYKPLKPDGTRADYTAGVFARRQGWGVIGLAGKVRDAGSKQLIYHEATHWLMSTDPSPRPKWFEEGMAELLSTFELAPGKVQWGKALQYHIDELAGGVRMPSRQLFNLGDDDPLFNNDSRTGAFYSTSWALTHYLIFSSMTERRQNLSRFLKLYAAESPDAAMSAAFGMNYDALDAELRSYLNGGRYGIVKLDRPAATEDAVVTAASPVIVHAALGRLAIGTGNVALAEAHADRGVGLDPGNVEIRELRAVIAQGQNRMTDAVHEAGMAVNLGSRNADLYVLVADHASSARESANLYEMAINRAPKLFRAHVGLQQALLKVDAPTAQDLEFLKLGRRVYPHSGQLTLGYAYVLDKRGDRAQARELLADLRRDGMQVTPQMLDFARGREARWAFDETMPKVQEHVSKAEFAKALALIDALEKQHDAADFRDNVQRMRVGTLAFERLQEASRLMSQGKRAEGRAILAEVASREGLPPGLKSQIETQLAGTAR